MINFRTFTRLERERKRSAVTPAIGRSQNRLRVTAAKGNGRVQWFTGHNPIVCRVVRRIAFGKAFAAT